MFVSESFKGHCPVMSSWPLISIQTASARNRDKMKKISSICMHLAKFSNFSIALFHFLFNSNTAMTIGFDHTLAKNTKNANDDHESGKLCRFSKLHDKLAQAK